MSGFPFSNVLSFADGYTSETSTGTPYFFVTDMEMSQQDLNENNQMSLSMTLAESEYCSLNGYDPQDPPCPRLILTGSIGKLSIVIVVMEAIVRMFLFFLWISFFFIEKIPEEDPEVDMARTSLFSRHPSMQYWPEGHGFYFAKMKIEHVILLASFGGAMDVPLADYFNASVE